MTVSTINTYSGPYLANGATTEFPFTFETMAGTDVQPILRDVDGNDTPVPANQYSVALTDPTILPSAGTVTFFTAPASGLTVFIAHNPEFLQDISFEDGSRWLAEPQNECHDRAVLLAQVAKARADRSIGVPIGELGPILPPAAWRTGPQKVLGTDSATGAIKLLPVSDLKGDPGGNIMAVGTYTQLALMKIPNGTDFIKTSGFSEHGDGGDAYYKQVDADPGVGVGGVQTADGKWWQYVINGPMRIEQFGGRGDLELTDLYGDIVGTPTDNIGPFNEMLKQLKYEVNDSYSGRQVFEFRLAGYYFSEALEPRAIVHLVGQGGGSDNLNGTIFKFPADTCGFICNNRQTGNGGVITPGTMDTAEGSTISDIYFLGSGGSDLTKHGIWMRATMKIVRCTVDNFAGHGFAIIATHVLDDPAKVGNANGWYLERCIVRSNGYHGLYVEGADANAGTAIAFQCKDTGHAGIVDISQFGNTYIGPEIDGTNFAIASGLPGAHAWQDGIYYELVTHDETLGGQTQPGTNEKVWYPWQRQDAPSSGVPQWTEGATYICGLAFYAVNSSVVIGMYTESILSHLTAGSTGIAIGGTTWWTRQSRALRGEPSAHDGLFVNSGVGGYRQTFGTPDYNIYGGFLQSNVGMPAAVNSSGFYFQEYGAESDRGLTRLEQGTDGDFSLTCNGLGAGNKPYWYQTGRRTTRKFGKPVPQPFFAVFPEFVVQHASDSSLTSTISAADAIPTEGTFALGDRVINVNPVPGGATEWTCTTSGSNTTTPWAAGTAYGIGALVTNGGNTYISQLAPAWAPGTAYVVDDVVSSFGANYRCIAAGTSGDAGPNGQVNLTDGDLKWVMPSGGLHTAWAPNTAYSVEQTVSNNGTTYQCITAGTSASSGGPTGYGNPIADGTAVWAFIGIPQVSGDTAPTGTGTGIQDGVIFWDYQPPFVLQESAWSNLEATFPYATTAIGANAVIRTNLTVPGAEKGDFCDVSWDGTMVQQINLTARVTGTDTVQIAFWNAAGTAGNIPDGNVRIRVRK